MGPSLSQDAGEVFAIAPFWVDNDFNLSRISYEIYEQGSSDSEERLDSVGQFVTNSTEVDDFEGKWMLLVEWRDCHPVVLQGQVNTIPTDLVSEYT